ncbi:ATP-dependent protease LonB [Syntrophomonas wolfei]|jgi:Lon-like ATP-dependent protease|uniref:endopeptidase La n=1 Tax=Syntrophomonas wolfei subsp. wolfei (strain DSM 2245B / Goettingen) TaxID=335541 RepID=Q0AWF2_SYNWW|nr:ATP-dependent protease LonB [Syntrophomonas wolfei]ABI68952.1 Endopeptidase La [Syntrophomonas wolfei subsp. wolfei str. Goettingen G311]
MNEFFVQYSGILYLIQLFFAIVIGLYFWNLLKNQQSHKTVMVKESEKESSRLKQMRNIKLSEPLSSLTRPAQMDDIIGQKEAVSILRSALCGPNPQHVIIFGPPGVGKTAAARLVLEEAKKNPLSPFGKDANFVEVDATISRFDERNIADPLIGSVHDPIYQGAGSMGSAGIPQPKPGACTRAHGGILFIDEIGELHSLQMNKLLKVLEDRKVMLESAYYTEYNRTIPVYIHEIFNHGLPADFRLVGATTRSPDELSPALRSRCLEIFFNPLTKEDIERITLNAAKKINFPLEPAALEEISRYANNGREAVNMVQLSAGIAQVEKQNKISLSIVEKVLNNGRFSPRREIKIKEEAMVGVVNGLAVIGANMGTLLEVEAAALSVPKGQGNWTVTGVVDEEQLGGQERQVRRKSAARGAVENVLTVLRSIYGLEIGDYNIHLNFPGGIPVDGPSAGISMATAIYSSITGKVVDNLLAMTGEISVYGKVKPVGGVIAKIEAARRAGVQKVIIPAENWLNIFDDFPDLKVIPVRDLDEVFIWAFLEQEVFPATTDKPLPTINELGLGVST